MASPTPKSRPQPLKPSKRPPAQPQPSSHSPEVVDPVWLIKAIGATLVAALLCGYLTLCLLFYQGQWQLILHPTRSTPAPANIGGAAFTTIHFGVDETAAPQLTGWWIPAEPGGRYAADTILYLPSGDGALADAAPRLAALHSLGINLFAFDYRGYGQSAPTRPNQRRMTEDATSAWKYLTVSRALSPSHIVLFGDGVGCALAAELAAAHPDAPAVILQSPRPDLLQVVLADPRTRSLPIRNLFHDRFEITGPASSLKTPKLFLIPASPAGSGDQPASNIQGLTATAATPKMISTLHTADWNGPIYREQIVRFLDQYVR
jgi:pimeloyl-ACP methyl ester carboxylesterase